MKLTNIVIPHLLSDIVFSHSLMLFLFYLKQFLSTLSVKMMPSQGRWACKHFAQKQAPLWLGELAGELVLPWEEALPVGGSIHKSGSCFLSYL